MWGSYHNFNMFIYNLIRYTFIYPLIFIISLFNGKKRRFFRERLFQDFSKLKKFTLRKEPFIMVHCSSMGETNLADPLIRKLLRDRKEKILLSVFTETGYENVKNRYSSEKRVEIIRFPLDDYFLIKRIIKSINLKMLIVVETEIWPNLIEQVSKKSRVIFINGRISDKSIGSYMRFKFFLKPIFQKVSYFFMQSEIDSERIISLGANSNRVSNVGNLKFCINFENYSERELEETKELINAKDRDIYVFGSTREEEEEKILPYLKKGKKKRVLIIVPRHLHRVEEIEKILRESGYTYNKYSKLLEDKRLENEKSENNTRKKIHIKKDVLIVDMMGVQRLFYALADAIFVGGTLVNIGGHSLLEPLFYGKTPIFGTHLNNVKDISKELIQRKLGYMIKNGEDFPLVAREILDSEDKKNEITKLFSENSKTLEKIVEKIQKMI